MINNTYPLEWLDTLILQTLNPKKINSELLSADHLSAISYDLLIENQKIQDKFKKDFFSLKKKREIRLLVRKYHSALVFFLDVTIEYQQHNIYQSPLFLETLNTVLRSLDELLTFLENRYWNYLSLDQRVPGTYLIVNQKEILLKLYDLKNKHISGSSNDTMMQIIIDILYEEMQTNSISKITYRQIFYLKELLKGLETVSDVADQTIFKARFNELVIGQNFNSATFINYYLGQITKEIELQNTLNQKLNLLLLYYKELRQLISNEKITFDPGQHNIKYVLENWFEHEINYLERKIEITSTRNYSSANSHITEKILIENKVECILSTDQMALILRAGDESRILKAKSMNMVFKTIVPHLSTPLKKELSYDAMRSKSYVAEEIDKEIAIKALERIIKHIQAF
jgi:hypothetical protein